VSGGDYMRPAVRAARASGAHEIAARIGFDT
jgi:hypothetical protein